MKPLTMRVALLSLLFLAAACGTPAGNVDAGTGPGTPPTIASLTMTPGAVPAGSVSTLSGTFVFNDGEGDVTRAVISVLPPSGAAQSLPPIALTAANGLKTGTLAIVIALNATTAGPYVLSLKVSDAAGNESNTLSFTVVAQLPDSGVSDAGSVDGGTADGGAVDGGAVDGGAVDGGVDAGGSPFEGYDAGCGPAGCGVTLPGVPGYSPGGTGPLRYRRGELVFAAHAIDGGASVAVRLPTDGGAATLSPPISAGAFIFDVLVDDSHLFWLETGTDAGVQQDLLARRPLAGGAPEVLRARTADAGSADLLVALVADDRNLFVVEARSDLSGRQLVRMLPDGGAPSIVADGLRDSLVENYAVGAGFAFETVSPVLGPGVEGFTRYSIEDGGLSLNFTNASLGAPVLPSAVPAAFWADGSDLFRLDHASSTPVPLGVDPEFGPSIVAANDQALFFASYLAGTSGYFSIGFDGGVVSPLASQEDGFNPVRMVAAPEGLFALELGTADTRLRFRRVPHR